MRSTEVLINAANNVVRSSSHSVIANVIPLRISMQLEREIIGRFIDASINNQVEAERLLTAHPALRNANWLGEEHILNFLVIENFCDGVSFCLTHGFDPNQLDGNTGTTPLHFACMLNYFEMAKILLEFGANPNSVCVVYDNPIHCAIRSGNAELVDFLIQKGADPNYRTESGETIFDNWPPWAENDLLVVIEKHCVEWRDN